MDIVKYGPDIDVLTLASLRRTHVERHERAVQQHHKAAADLKTGLASSG